MGKGPKSIQSTTNLPGVKEYCSYHDNKEHQIVHCRNLQRYLKELVRQSFIKKYVFTLGATSDAGQSSAPPPTQPQHIITEQDD